MIKNGNYDSVPISSIDLNAVPEEFRDDIQSLFEVWRNVRARNAELTMYYTMKNNVKNIGVSTPPQFEKISSVVGWCHKAVQTHAIRSVFDGFVFGGNADPELDEIVRRNRLASLYQRAVISSLIHGVSAFTVMLGRKGQPDVKIRSHSANQFAVLWDKNEDRIKCGIILGDVDKDNNPIRYIAHFPNAVLTIDAYTKADGTKGWTCEVEYHKMNRPLMEVLVNNPDDDSPLGHTMLTPELRAIVDKAMRDVLRMEIGAEFFTFPQRYFLGVDSDMFAAPVDEDVPVDEDGDPIDAEGNKLPRVESQQKKWQAYIGSILAISRDDNGDIPSVGQFSPSNAANFTAMFENDAQRFSGATNVPLAQLGVLSNTYTSSDALSATNDPLILEVEWMNKRNAEAMENVALMTLAILQNKSIEELSYEQRSVQAVFVDPSMPTISSRADAYTKIGSQDKSLVGTRAYYEGLGFSKPLIDRILQEKQQVGAIEALNTIAQSVAAQVAPTLVEGAAEDGQ